VTRFLCKRRRAHRPPCNKGYGLICSGGSSDFVRDVTSQVVVEGAP
jgi:hypothetical protein